MGFSSNSGLTRVAEAPHPFLYDDSPANSIADADEMAFLASEALPTQNPELSAKTGLTIGQRIVFGRLAALAGIMALFLPVLFLKALWLSGLMIFSILIVWRASLVLIGAAARLVPSAKPVPEMAVEDLPVYTLLIPLYDEVAAIPTLAKALSALDYPPERLDIKLLSEAFDTATLSALANEHWGSHVEILALPGGQPLTKPRALNFGLQRARGEYVAIYDAEDHPHPCQLKAALAAFSRGGARLACVQAPLKAQNPHASWLASQWSLEYAVHFNLVLPALTLMHLPVPLGGTSNHFRLDALRHAGGWDAWNVTEDADLGLRLAHLGWQVGSIRPMTLEEAPETLRIWTAQRSRWVKGYMQTWLVLMRRPEKVRSAMGTIGFLATQLNLAGSILSALVNGPIFAWVLICILLPSVNLGLFDAIILSIGYLVNAAAALIAPGRFSLSRLIAVLTLPFYWPLQSIAAARALYGLARRPHFWAKTPHGLTTRRMDPTLAFAE